MCNEHPSGRNSFDGDLKEGRDLQKMVLSHRVQVGATTVIRLIRLTSSVCRSPVRTGQIPGGRPDVFGARGKILVRFKLLVSFDR